MIHARLRERAYAGASLEALSSQTVCKDGHERSPLAWLQAAAAALRNASSLEAVADAVGVRDTMAPRTRLVCFRFVFLNALAEVHS